MVNALGLRLLSSFAESHTYTVTTTLSDTMENVFLLVPSPLRLVCVRAIRTRHIWALQAIVWSRATHVTRTKASRRMPRYRRSAHRVSLPVLFVISHADALSPAAPAEGNVIHQTVSATAYFLLRTIMPLSVRVSCSNHPTLLFPGVYCTSYPHASFFLT